jgi:hemerythrin-like metal-binding protein
MIIQLWRNLEASKSIEAARKAAMQLMDETIGHFAREEEFMRQCGFPQLATHRSRHQELAASLRQTVLTPITSHDGFVNAVCTLMGRWVSHIMTEDAKLAPYARQLATQMAAARKIG